MTNIVFTLICGADGVSFERSGENVPLVHEAVFVAMCCATLKAYLDNATRNIPAEVKEAVNKSFLNALQANVTEPGKFHNLNAEVDA